MVAVDVLERLAVIPPGAELARALGALDLAGVPNDRIVDVLQAQARQLAHDQARMLFTIGELSRSTPPPDDAEPDRRAGVERAAVPYEWASGELAAALRLTARTADRELAFAETVMGLPWVFAALLTGQIDRTRTWVFADHLDPTRGELTPDQIETICAQLVPLAPGLTSGQLAARLLRAIIAIDPAQARRRYTRSVRERAVVGFLDRDGTVTVTASGLPPAEATAACERLDRLAAAVKRAGHPGRLGQIQTDLFLGMLDGRFHHRTGAQIIADLLAHPRPEDACGDDPAATGTDIALPGSAGDAPAYGHATPEAVPPPGDPAPAEAAPKDAAPSDRSTPGWMAPDETAPSEMVSAGDPVSGETARSGVPVPGAVEGPMPRTGIEIRVGLATLLGLDERPGEIPGLGPVLADVARDVVAAQQRGAQWRFAVTDADGYLLLAGATRRRPQPHRLLSAVGTCRGGIVELHVSAEQLAHLAADPRTCGPWASVVADLAAQYDRCDELVAALDQHPSARFPGAALARHVEVRDRTCTRPGCRRRASRCDLDHTRDRAHGGATTRRNIGPQCARHHHDKHERGWRVRQPEPGHFEWTSPLGRIYRTRGEPITLPPPDPRPHAPEPEDHDAPRYLDGPILEPPRRSPGPPRPPPTVSDSDEAPPF